MPSGRSLLQGASPILVPPFCPDLQFIVRRQPGDATIGAFHITPWGGEGKVLDCLDVPPNDERVHARASLGQVFLPSRNPSRHVHM